MMQVLRCVVQHLGVDRGRVVRSKAARIGQMVVELVLHETCVRVRRTLHFPRCRSRETALGGEPVGGGVDPTGVSFAAVERGSRG